MSFSTLSSWALVIWKTLSELGEDPRSIFMQAGLDPALLGKSQARFDLKKMQNLWEISRVKTGRLDFGVLVGKSWSPTTFHALGFAWLASQSLFDGLKRLVRYSDLVNDGIEVSVCKTKNLYSVAFFKVDESMTFSSTSIDASIVSFTKMARLLYGEEFAPFKIIVGSTQSESVLPIENYIQCEITFRHNSNSPLSLLEIKLHDYQVEKLLSSKDELLAQLNDHVAEKYIAKLATSSIRAKVARLIFETLPSGELSESKLAETLNLTVRTLQRKLADEGATFNGMVTDIRMKESLRHIDNESMSLSEIAFLLGFTEQSNFSRAFRKWFGQSPTQYRKSQILKIA